MCSMMINLNKAIKVCFQYTYVITLVPKSTTPSINEHHHDVQRSFLAF